MAKLICPIQYGALHFPELPALTCADKTLNYRQLHHAVQFMQGQLVIAGFHAGDHLFIAQKNGCELITLMWACWREGVVICPVNPAFPQDKQLQLKERMHARSFDPQLLYALDQAPDPMPDFPLSEPDPLIELDNDRLSDLILTSGSTGMPKAVAHYLRNHIANAQGSQVPITQGDGWLLSLPLYHVGGMAILFRCLLAGATIVLPHPEYSLAEQLHRESITHLSLVPTQLYRLLHTPDFHFAQTKVKHLLLGGAPLPDSLIQACQAQSLTPWVSYGLSEMASQVCTCIAGQPGMVGKALPGREVQLQKNEICVRGDTLFAGYFQPDGALNLPLDEQGWFHTGDSGYWIQDQLVISGRLDNQFISGGENIQPEQIEQQLLQHDAIAQAVIVPVPDKEWGMRCVCFLNWHGTAQPFADIAQWLRQFLPGYLIPKNWLEWPELPSGMLKIQRSYFREIAREQLKKIPV